MRGRFRVPMFVSATALLVLIAVLATLQYRWLGRISDAERDRLKAVLNSRASAFAQDFDRELTRAYLTFQVDPLQAEQTAASRTASRYDRWQSTARYPRLIKDVYLVGADSSSRLQRFNPATRFVEPADWPAALDILRAQLAAPQTTTTDGGTTIFRTLPPAVMDTVPALIVPTPLLEVTDHGVTRDVGLSSQVACTVLLLDRDYMVNELLPALARQHFRGTGDGVDYQLAVVRPEENAVVYRSDQTFSPAGVESVDASIDLFQVRLQDFGDLVSEVRRFSTFFAATQKPDVASGIAGRSGRGSHRAIVRETFTTPLDGSAHGSPHPGAPVSIVVEQRGPVTPDKLVAAAGAAVSRLAVTSTPRWRLMVKHPSGSLEHAVDAARRRNLIVSSGILAVLGVSLGFLFASTRRAHALARQQMEFVATVSHELRSPLAVIRSAADNLADGVVNDEARVRRYGELVRGEGRRLSELVEQILEYAGLQSGERFQTLRPIALAGVLREVVADAQTQAAPAGVLIELNISNDLPAVAGDESALRRVFHNLVGNAVKYGAGGRWVGLQAHATGTHVEVTVSDRGIGIPPADQERIFDPFYRAPDVVAAQIQGAGLGLSLVKRIVDAHRGRISVISTPGAGSTFTVTLPVAANEAAEATDGARATAPQHS